MSEFLRTLIPWANWWNAVILSIDIIVIIVFILSYRKTRSRSLLTSMPGLFTSLGILGTFGAICFSLAGISAEPETVSNVGKTIEEAASSTVGSLDIKRIISDLIPAFSTSIYGLVLAFFATVITKLVFASEDALLEKTLKYKDPETALQAVDEHVQQLMEVSSANNDKLNDSIVAQSAILSTFVDTFMDKMKGTFEAMNTTIEERVSNFGTTQYTQSREILENITKKLGEDAKGIIDAHNESVKTMTDASTADLAAIKETLATAVANLKTDTVSGIEELTRKQNESLQKLADDSLSLHMEASKEQNKFNEELIAKMSSSLSETTTSIINGVGEQIKVLKEALVENIGKLQEAYEFIDDKSASIISNYEQVSETYRDAVKNAHDLNERVEKGLVTVNTSLKEVGQTNESVQKAVKLIEDKETNMEAIVMRIESLSSAIATLERLESVLSRISAK